MNKLKCSSCVHFDEQYKFVNGRRVPLWYGLCAKRTVYPAKEQDGQVFPEGVKRAEEGQLAQPAIVQPGAVIPGCLDAMQKG